MKKLILSLLVIFLLPAISNGQELVQQFSAQHQFDTQYAQADMKYAFENYKGSVKSWQKKFRSELADLLGITKLQKLYKDFVPTGFSCDDVITYQWKESTKEDGLRGKFNFYLNIKREAISAASMVVYMILLVIMGGFGNFFAEFVFWLFSLI